MIIATTCVMRTNSYANFCSVKDLENNDERPEALG